MSRNTPSRFSNYSGASGTQSPSDSLTESRKRQSKKDEAIRRKLETDLSKRSHVRAKPVKKIVSGTVMALKPSPAVTIKPKTSVAEAAQLMSAKRENCVLVIEDDNISGIFTAKDLAFKVVGSGLDASVTTVDQIMTRNPLYATTDTSATEGLNLMVNKGFRHLPVMDENNEVSGILDITKCYHEAMEKLERAYQSSRKLYDALEGVQTELGSSQPAQIINYVEALKQRMEGPDLESVLDGTPPTYVGVRTTVYEAASLMKQNHTTAVLVTDHDQVKGIFTSKDVVLRVIAAGLDPKNCSVIRVMTPHPDVAPQNMSIQVALRTMHEGRYLNLPVMGPNAELVGVVDVLKLTYATLEQINTMSTGDSEGPAWNKFWMSLDEGSEAGSESNSHNRIMSPVSVSSPEVSHSELAQFGVGEVGPSDSISTDGYERPGSNAAGMIATMPFQFKFKSPSGRNHRLTVVPNAGVSALRNSISDKLSVTDVELVTQGYAISYIDDEGDIVAITSDQDLLDAVSITRRAGLEKADLFIHHPDNEVKPVVSQKLEDSVEIPAKPVNAPAPEIIPGISNDLLLPGAVAVVAAACAVAFSLGRAR